MLEFLIEIGLFSSKLLISLVVLMVIISLFGVALADNKKMKKKKKLKVEDLGETLQSYCLELQSHTQPTKETKKKIKLNKKQKKKEQNTESPCAYVLNFKGDIQASQVQRLRDEISILIKTARPKKDEVILRLNNQGGAVAHHGLGASQLQRLRDAGIYLTVCVDIVAGSGGYLMACVANKIIATPFALIGSIGVLMQMPNFHRFLQKQNVDYEEHSAGKHKRTLTLFGEATEEKREKLREKLEEIHGSFKQYVAQYRPHLDLAQTATGDYWLGTKAKELGLIDSISTSDDYIMSLLNTKKVYYLSLKETLPTGLQSWIKKKVSHNSDLLLPLLTIKKLVKKILSLS